MTRAARNSSTTRTASTTRTRTARTTLDTVGTTVQ